MLCMRKAEALTWWDRRNRPTGVSNRMLTIVFILGMREGNRKSQKPREVKTEAAVETARDLRESQSRECAE